MAMAHNPTPSSVATSMTTEIFENNCSICENIIRFATQDCYKLMTCSHIFHRNCIESSLSSSSNCPTCQVPCELSDLKKCSSEPLIAPENRNQSGSVRKSKPSGRGKPRGATANRPLTRSFIKNITQF